MARTNVKTQTAPISTHEGATAVRITPEKQLRRLVMANMLWEDTFYVDGKEIGEQIADAVAKVKPEVAQKTAIEARTQMKLRHVPLWIVRNMARGSKEQRLLVADTLREVIQRPDELTEFVAMYRKDKREPLSAQVKKGLREAFGKFTPYQFSKYDRDGAYKLRDVMFLVHPPSSGELTEVFKKLADKAAVIKGGAQTWEVGLSEAGKAGAELDAAERAVLVAKNKKESFEGLLKENQMGALALLRNLRNMQQLGIEQGLIEGALESMKVERVLPFRFITAARHNPQIESAIEKAMLKALGLAEKLPGKTVLLIDVSGSMNGPISGKSEVLREDAASGLAILLREIADDVSVYTFSDSCVQVPARRGFALRDAIRNSQPHSSTMTAAAVGKINQKEKYDRLIVVSDEQAHDGSGVPLDGKLGYFINVAPYKNGIGYGRWQHIDGWSEAVIEYVREYEKEIAAE